MQFKINYAVFMTLMLNLKLSQSFTIFNARDISSASETQKREIPLSLAFKHKTTADFVKRLVYAANTNDVNENSLDYGLVPIDLNLLSDDILAFDIESGVEQELYNIDRELGETPSKSEAEESKIRNMMNVSLMHQGMYDPSPQFNSLIDGLIVNVQKDFRRRAMDPLYFTVHDKGVVRHTINKTDITSSPSPAVDSESKARDALGGGDIKGLLKLKRFGNSESRRDGNITLVRSHYFFGPLEIDLVFRSRRGLRSVNSTLTSLAAHALHEVSNVDDSVTLREFLTDSPMEYEIQLLGTKNQRLRRLSQTAIKRLFKRDGRMEVRILRSFRRAASKPVRSIRNGQQQNRRTMEKFIERNTKRPKVEDPKV